MYVGYVFVFLAKAIWLFVFVFLCCLFGWRVCYFCVFVFGGGILWLVCC